MLFVGRGRSVSARPRPRAALRGAVRRARLAPARHGGRRKAFARPAARARAAVSARTLDGPPTTCAPAPDRARAPPLRARRGDRAGRAGDGARAARPTAREVEERRDPRPARRLAGADQALRLARAGACSTRSQTRSRGARSPRGCRADYQRVHDGARTGGGDRARGRVPRVHGSRAVHRDPPSPLPEAPRRSSSACSSATRRSTCSPTRGAAWRRGARRGAARRRPGSAGAGRRASRRRAAGRVEWTPSLTAEEVAAALDASTLLVLPSRSEGMGRVVVEAAAPRPGGCRKPGRRDPGRRRGRRDRPPRPSRTTRARSRKRSSACSPIVRSRNAWAPRRVYESSHGWRHPRSTHGESATWSRQSSRRVGRAAASAMRSASLVVTARARSPWL